MSRASHSGPRRAVSGLLSPIPAGSPPIPQARLFTRTNGIGALVAAALVAFATVALLAYWLIPVGGGSPQGSPPAPMVPSPTSVTGGPCASSPHVCGYPDATNSGVPAGTTLRSVPGQVSSGPGWHYDSRGWVTVDGAGAVLDALDIPYNVDVTAANVTIKNSRITLTGESFGVSLRHTSNVTVQDSTISSPEAGTNRLMVGVKDVYANSTGTRVLRNNIFHTATGVQMDAGLIQDNYIHDMGLNGTDHVNGTTSNGSDGSLLTITHNTVFNSFSQTDAVSLFSDFGAQKNRVVDNNLLAGGGYTIYSGGSGDSAIRITNNRISRIYYPNGGANGPLAYWNPSGSGNVWSGNVWDGTGEPCSS